MGKEYTEIDAGIQRWMARQHVFFVATAPREDGGHVNCSPKGLDSLRVLGPRKLAYADTGGSGIETVAHLKQNGRITLMLCAFDGSPKIFRFYGSGRVVEPHDTGFADLAGQFPELPAIRNLVVIEVDLIKDSCGFGVPLYEFRRQRDSLANDFAKRSDEDILDYRRERNAFSIDGLPGLEVARIGEEAASS